MINLKTEFAETKQDSRVEELDILKGFLIIFVIIGHSRWAYTDYIYWFHMPLFFVCSGMVLNIPPKKEIGNWIKQRSRKFFVPYLIAFSLESWIRNDFTVKSIIKFLYGGRLQPGVYWYITCLFISLIVVVYIENKVPPKNIKFVYAMLYLSAIFESNILIPTDTIDFPSYLKFPWNIDVCLLAVVFIGIGYHLKGNLKTRLEVLYEDNIRITSLAMSIIFLLILVFCKERGIYSFDLDMKYSQYKNIILVLLVPLACGSVLMSNASLLKNGGGEVKENFSRDW